jgi:hypothetical protein
MSYTFLEHFSMLIYETRKDGLVTFSTERSLKPNWYLRISMLVLLDLDMEMAMFASEITPKLGSLCST